MYDLHCHILPEIDDGSPSMQYSLDMARFAVEHGTTHLVATPHIHPGRYDNEKETIKSAFDALKQAIHDEGIELEIGMAAEIRLSAEVLMLFQQKKIPFLGEEGDTSVLLLELPHDQVPPGSEGLVDWLSNRSCKVMIAHPERNKGIMRQPELLNAFIKRGCYVQVTSGAIAGRFGEQAKKVAEKLLLDGSVTVVASDAHNLTHRTPDLSEGHARVVELLGIEAANALFIDNPKRITAKQFQ